jgi:microcystin-dependent protein
MSCEIVGNVKESAMGTPFLSEIKIVSFNFAPKGWALCAGQLLPINQNQALFSLLGTTYGGDGRVNFGLPNLQGRVPIHMGSGFVLGQLGGEPTHTLSISELPTHTHQANGSSTAISSGSPANDYWGDGSTLGTSLYNNTAINQGMAGNAITVTGGSQPHENQSPYLVLNCVIALQGIFPSQT